MVHSLSALQTSTVMRAEHVMNFKQILTHQLYAIIFHIAAFPVLGRPEDLSLMLAAKFWELTPPCTACLASPLPEMAVLHLLLSSEVAAH